MNPQAQSRAFTRRKAGNGVIALVLAAAVLLLLAGCSAGKASSADPSPQKGPSVDRNAIKLTLSVDRGPVGTSVQVDVSGAKAGPNGRLGFVWFRDRTDSAGEDSLTTDYELDSRNLGADGSLHVTYRIPEKVLVKESPDAQAATKKAPTSAGQGLISFTSADGFTVVETPFEVMPRTDQEQTRSVEKNGVKITISPTSGAINSGVQVDITGVKPIAMAPFGVVSFRDSTGAGGEDSLTTDFTIDTRKTRDDGSLRVLYRVPANVLVKAEPDAQNPTKKTPTSLGPATIVFSWAGGEIEVPFTLVAYGEALTFPAASPADIVLGGACSVVSGPDGGAEGMRTWVLRCQDAGRILGPAEARPALEKALADGGWQVCRAAAGTTYYRSGDRITALAFAENNRSNPRFGEVYLSQSPRASECA